MGKLGSALFCRIYQVLFLLFLFSGHVLADEVILTNGDRLTGEILEIKDGILTLETDYSDPIKLKFGMVQQMSSSEPVEIHLTDGEILKGKITAEMTGQVVVDAGAGRGAVAVKFDNIAALNPPPKEPARWKGNITLGGNWQDGNTDTMNISAGALAVRRTDNDRFLINFL
jgi:hypothetical protein